MQICLNGQWRFVCDDGWDKNATEVLCKNLYQQTEGEECCVTIDIVKRMPTPKQKSFITPSLHLCFFLMCSYLLFVDKNTARMQLIPCQLKVCLHKQRCRDGVMNEFLFWCGYPLVPLLFHEGTSLHFREMIFPLVLSTTA